MVPFRSCRSRSLNLPALAGLFGSGIVACGGVSTLATTDSGQVVSTADGGVDADATASTSVTPANLIIEPDEGMTPIYTLISSAKTSIDMTMYELTDTTATNLLVTTAKAGVTVRVVLDQNLEKSSNTTAFNTLSAGGVQVHWASTVYSATHQKTITIDGATSAIMTLNLASQDYKTSRDFAIITTEPADVQAIETTFAADFGGSQIIPPDGTDLVWSPTNSESSLTGIINGAHTTLLVENEEMSNSTIVSALSSAATRGVTVEIIMTASSSWTTEFNTLKAAGVKIVTYSSRAPLYIHAKAIVADHGTSTARVFIGSENFSNASLTSNRELGTITTDPAVMDSMNATLSKDFSGGTAF